MEQHGDAYREFTAEVKRLHECFDGFRDEQQELKTLMGNNFLGIDAPTHVKHHNTISAKGEISGDRRRAWYELVGIVLATVIINCAAVSATLAGVTKAVNSPEHIEAISKDNAGGHH